MIGAKALGERFMAIPNRAGSVAAPTAEAADCAATSRSTLVGVVRSMVVRINSGYIGPAAMPNRQSTPARRSARHFRPWLASDVTVLLDSDRDAKRDLNRSKLGPEFTYQRPSPPQEPGRSF